MTPLDIGGDLKSGSTRLLLGALGLWLLLMLIAILNGMIREGWLVPQMGPRMAFPMSGVILSVLVFAVTLTTVRWLPVTSTADTWKVGGFWLLVTIAFEFLFGHFVLGESWDQLLAAYSPGNGNLWLLVLFTILVSPFLAAKTRGIV